VVKAGSKTKAIETEFNKMSVIRFEMDEDDMEEDKEGECSTNKTQDQPGVISDTNSKNDISEAGTTPAN
jgi:hypothetical protein